LTDETVECALCGALGFSKLVTWATTPICEQSLSWPALVLIRPELELAVCSGSTLGFCLAKAIQPGPCVFCPIEAYLTMGLASGCAKVAH